MTAAARMFVTTAKGTEQALEDELREIGLGGVKATRGGVRFTGSIHDGMRACLWSRLASRVLLMLRKAPAPEAEALYEGALAVEWEEHLNPRGTFAVRATTRSVKLAHSGYVALKVKDAIADRLRDRKGKRPDVDAKRPDVLVFVHLADDQASFYLDLSGEPLHRRGWRGRGGQAPLKENLAAAVLRIGGYEHGLPMCDPMCGSGTLPIEAALAARGIAPGLGRGFGFETWPAVDEEVRRRWRDIREEAKAVALPRAPAEILGFDRSGKELDQAGRCARRAGVSGDIRLELRDVRHLQELPEGCQVFTNPPYGERLGRRRLQLEGLYRRMRETLLENEQAGKVVILSGNPAIEKTLGGSPVMRHELFNGPLRCRLLAWSLPGERPVR